MRTNREIYIFSDDGWQSTTRNIRINKLYWFVFVYLKASQRSHIFSFKKKYYELKIVPKTFFLVTITITIKYPLILGSLSLTFHVIY